MPGGTGLPVIVAVLMKGVGSSSVAGRGEGKSDSRMNCSKPDLLQHCSSPPGPQGQDSPGDLATFVIDLANTYRNDRGDRELVGDVRRSTLKNTSRERLKRRQGVRLMTEVLGQVIDHTSRVIAQNNLVGHCQHFGSGIRNCNRIIGAFEHGKIVDFIAKNDDFIPKGVKGMAKVIYS